MNQEKAIELLEKFATGNLGLEEEVMLHDWIESADRESIEAVMEKYEGIAINAATNEADPLLFLRIKEKIAEIDLKESDILHPSPLHKKFEKAKVRRLFPWRSVAAAILIIMAGTGGYFAFKDKKRENEIVKTTAQDIKAPISNKAVITLANGKQIVLDSAGNGTLAMQGNVTLVKKDNGQIEYSASGSSLSGVGYNTLTNPRGSKVINLTLSDGSRVWLNAESSLRYPAAFSGKERTVSITGEAYFEVRHDPTRPFIVRKGDMQVKVLGTHFNVNAYDDETQMKITLLEGAVKVSLGSSGKMIKPGEQAQIKNHNNSLPPEIIIRAVDVDEEVAWKNGLFYFNKVDLQTVLRQLTKWYDVDVAYQGNIPKQTFGGDMERTLSLSQVLKILEKSEVHFKIDGKKIIVMP